MGIETTKALRARRRESAARIERLIAAGGRTQSDRHRRAGHESRRRLGSPAGGSGRSRPPNESVAAIEVEIGQALLRLVGQGMSRNEAFELVGLSRHHGPPLRPPRR